ncbi:uncharacterized protein LOC101449255 isoform X1 [Ceratitis capitata]|uniref:(Mediterranean fruit fly) hypothetical protein n=2 Tax=Ceratitis capitata TaxID=7213 RepID=A0A811TYJ1_CERCA|nr:uncharacterized protein LOC101449255 isoform X1 [Ceratitis capitata]CAD6991218.1 unnamed protein product [Ceratitis capitata]
MSEVAKSNEIEQNTVPVEQTTVEEVATVAESAPTSTEAETPAAAEKQVVNNSIEAKAGAGDAGTSAAEAAKSAESSPNVENKKTPAKRTPSKRMSFIERAQKESEELVKNMGGSLELDGGRRTRSSTRGTPTRASAVSTPPPAKKARTSPANASNTPSRGKGRGRKIDISDDLDEPKEVTKTTQKSKTTNKKQADAEKSSSPLKEESEPVAELSAAAEVKEAITESKEEENIEKPEEMPDTNADVIDASKQNEEQCAESEKAVEEPIPVKNESEIQMETDEPTPEEEPLAVPSELESNSETDESNAKVEPTEVTASTVTVPKEITIEPMEVDSNSKSSDVELVETVPATTAPTANESESSAPLVEPQAPEVLAVSNITDEESVVQTNDVNNVAENSEVAPEAPVACDVGSLEANVNTVTTTNEDLIPNAKAEAIIENQATIELTNSEDDINTNNQDSLKPENELCVPKVVSPSITNANTDGSVATIL